MKYKDNFWDQAYYVVDGSPHPPRPSNADPEFYWMPMDPTGPKPWYRINESTQREEEQARRDEFADIMDYCWPDQSRSDLQT
jgi:hypothetical protein